MRRFRIFLLSGLFGAIAPTWAQDYLTNDREPADEAAEMVSPFTSLSRPSMVPGVLRERSREPFIHDAEFSLQPRFYYRSVRNAAGVQDTFAGGGAFGLTTGWWRDMIQFGAVGYTTQPLAAVRSDNRSGLVKSNGEGFFTLGEAWAKVRTGPATATLFRQILNMPFINADDSRMIPNTFEAYQVEATPWASANATSSSP